MNETQKWLLLAAALALCYVIISSPVFVLGWWLSSDTPRVDDGPGCGSYLSEQSAANPRGIVCPPAGFIIAPDTLAVREAIDRA